ncbi:Ger(x)C family spore germination protein [Cytobacillus kochii]|uniref:Ger(x)C family spore germination protein n=1 Tax=Cytobacillus kochii TaxID=859143 RepID=UPI00203E1747|nr:Ger(x)C family spore germination protein [Cytobacillus kochii]MCM3324882.1 Ger(x)C family spore germination protein [Cytobacillus kochii]MCM3347326.1 Ger(x)C family spore germination protein [Cytobacillus kochii]MDM5209125.1 Ger(x)C family spore germination protein [Cytobacillus kochii]
MKKWICVICCLFILTGCVQKRIIDELNIAVATGFDPDTSDEHLLKTTFLMEIFNKEMSVENKTVTTTGDLRKETLYKANRQAPSPIVVGGLRLTLYNIAIAERGLSAYVDAYQRDASIGKRIYFATTDSNTEDIFKGEYGPQGNGSFISDLIEHNIDYGDLPKTNLTLFMRDFYQEGKDIFLPHIKKINEQEIELAGISLFKDHAAYKILPSDKLFYFKLLVDRYSRGDFSIELPDGEKVAIQSIHSNHKYKLDKKDPTNITIKIKVQGNIKEYSGNNIDDKKIKEITNFINKKIKNECLALIKSFQEDNADPIGLGKVYSTKIRNFDYKEWKEGYPDLNIKVDPKVIILDTGASI